MEEEIEQPSNPTVSKTVRKSNANSRMDKWWHNHPRVAVFLPASFFIAGVWGATCVWQIGIAVVVLAVAGSVMSLRPKMKPLERAGWLFVLGLLAYAETRAIVRNATENENKTAQIVNGVNNSVDLGKQNLAIANTLLATIQIQSRSPNTPSAAAAIPLAKAWGAVSQLKSPSVKGASSSAANPPVMQSGKRAISPEALATLLKAEHAIGTATVINDGTNESGNFAKQLEIGLQMASWVVGGDNVKMGDPEFFPDSLTIEVAASPANAEDSSKTQAKELQEALKKQGIESAIRFTTLQFPANFLRIKVASQ